MNDFDSKKVNRVNLYFFFIYKYFSNLFRKNLKKNSSLKKAFDDKREIKGYLKEPEIKELVRDLKDKKKLFRKLVHGKTQRGNTYRLGAIQLDSCKGLYALIRKTKPEVLVETGVCNGISTSFILTALHKNNKGKLTSIDFPEVADEFYENGDFWKDKGGAVIPKGKKSGWVIQDHLRDRWTLIEGKSEEKLPPLITELKEIDFFIHDSNHTYECMMFEYKVVYDSIKKKGILASDDIVWNNAFDDFCEQKDKKLIYIGPNVGFMIK